MLLASLILGISLNLTSSGSLTKKLNSRGSLSILLAISDFPSDFSSAYSTGAYSTGISSVVGYASSLLVASSKISPSTGGSASDMDQKINLFY